MKTSEIMANRVGANIRIREAFLNQVSHFENSGKIHSHKINDIMYLYRNTAPHGSGDSGAHWVQDLKWVKTFSFMKLSTTHLSFNLTTMFFSVQDRFEDSILEKVNEILFHKFGVVIIKKKGKLVWDGRAATEEQTEPNMIQEADDYWLQDSKNEKVCDLIENDVWYHLPVLEEDSDLNEYIQTIKPIR